LASDSHIHYFSVHFSTSRHRLIVGGNELNARRLAAGNAKGRVVLPVIPHAGRPASVRDGRKDFNVNLRTLPKVLMEVTP
jgi:hypothetical protein